eukprot:s55_g38.t1
MDDLEATSKNLASQLESAFQQQLAADQEHEKLKSAREEVEKLVKEQEDAQKEVDVLTDEIKIIKTRDQASRLQILQEVTGHCYRSCRRTWRYLFKVVFPRPKDEDTYFNLEVLMLPAIRTAAISTSGSVKGGRRMVLPSHVFSTLVEGQLHGVAGFHGFHHRQLRQLELHATNDVDPIGLRSRMWYEFARKRRSRSGPHDLDRATAKCLASCPAWPLALTLRSRSMGVRSYSSFAQLCGSGAWIIALQFAQDGAQRGQLHLAQSSILLDSLLTAQEQRWQDSFDFFKGLGSQKGQKGQQDGTSQIQQESSTLTELPVDEVLDGWEVSILEEAHVKLLRCNPFMLQGTLRACQSNHEWRPSMALLRACLGNSIEAHENQYAAALGVCAKAIQWSWGLQLAHWLGYREPSTSGAVAATVGCSVLGMVVAGPLGAMVGAGLAVAATQPNATLFPLLQRGRHTIANVSLPRDGISAEHQEDADDGARVLPSGISEIRCLFPGKTFFSCRGDELEQRRLALEAWTRDMLRVFSSTGIPNRLQAEFEDFFTRGRGEARPPAPLPPAAPAAPAPPAPPAPGQAFAVEVPGGVHAGQQLMVKNPMDGSSFLITVPLGAGPGSILQVSPPANASSLGVAVPSSSPVQAPAGEQKILLSISIPPGVAAGQTLGVKVPDGRELTVVVPPGLGQQEVQLEYDAVSGSLDVVTSQPAPAPAAPSAPSAPPAPVPAMAPMAPMAPAAGGEHFNFRIPRGVVPGQIVKIQVPDGRYLPLLIPNYKFAGDAQLKRKLIAILKIQDI